MGIKGVWAFKYFLNLENENFTPKIIHKIEKDNGNIIVDQKTTFV